MIIQLAEMRAGLLLTIDISIVLDTKTIKNNNYCIFLQIIFAISNFICNFAA